jgi:tetratricopeptide (TPR) repeat protein
MRKMGIPSRTGLVAAVLLATLSSGAFAQDGFDIQEKCDTDFRVGMEYWRSRQIPDALELFTNVVEACPERVEAYFFKGRCEADMKQYEEAIRTFRGGLDVDPNHKGIRENLAFAYLAAGQADQGIDVYRGLIQEDPDKVDYWLRMGAAADQIDRTTDAIMALSRATELKADSLGVWKVFDYYLLKSRLLLPALQTGSKIYFREPDNVDVMSRLGKGYTDAKQHARALPIYEEIYSRLFPEDGSEPIEFDQKRAGDLWNYANALKGVKQYVEAARVFEKVLEHPQYADNASAWVQVAFIYKDGKLYDKCIEAARKALQIDAANCAAMCALGKGYEGQALDLEGAKSFTASIGKVRDAKQQFDIAGSTCTGTWGNYATKESERMTKHLERIQQKAAMQGS